MKHIYQLMRPEGMIWQRSKLRAIVPLLVALNLSLGAPLLCHLHCLTLTGESAGSGHLLHYHGQDAGGLALAQAGALQPILSDHFVGEKDAAQASPAPSGLPDDLPQFHCPDGKAGPSHLAVSGTYESANLGGDSPIPPRALTALVPAPQAALASIYLPPPERPPAATLHS